MAVFPSDSIRTKNWGTEVLTDSDLETQLDLLHAYLQSALNATTGHAHTGASNQGPKISPANMVITSQAQGDTLYASSATAWARLAKGTAAQILSMNTGATAPQWESAGTSANNIVRLDGNAKLPAVDGSLLTGITNASLGTSAGSAPLYAARAWVNFDGTTTGIRAAGNVSSTVRNALGNYTINFTTAIQDDNYSVVGNCNATAAGGESVTISTQGTTSVRIMTTYRGQAIDCPVICVVVFR